VLLTFSECELDTALFKLIYNGQPQNLEPQVFSVLLYLIQHRNRIISRQELMDELWAGKVVSESTLSSTIKVIRQAVGDNGLSQNCIATFNRRGYRFISSIAELFDDNTQAKLQLDNIEQPPHQGRASIAVLPFTHNHCSESVAWIADMLSEDISIQLARIPGFLLISRNSTAYYRDQDINLEQVARELGTAYIVEGSIRQVGDHLNVSVQLSDTENHQILWTDQSEILFDNLFELQNDVVHKIIGQIEPELNRAELAILKKRRTVNLSAWSLYRKAHATLSLKGWNEESFHESVDLLRQAILQDPELAFAHAYLSLILAIGHLVGLINDKDCHKEARLAAETALTLDGQDSDVLGYTGCAFADMGDYQRGVNLMRRSIELDPSNAQAQAALGAALLRIGEEEGISKIRYGIRISPRDSRLAIWGTMLARGLLSLGYIDDAIEAADYACRCDDKIFLPRLVLAVAQNTAGNIEGARAALNDARRIRPQLSENDLALFAIDSEVESLKQVGLV
jgi:adenylate cyclase